MMHHPRLTALMLACAGAALTAACTQDAGDYPRLLPTAQVLAEPVLPEHAAPVAQDPAPVTTAVNDRAEALRARAAALRRPVIEPGLRDRMLSATGGGNS